MTLIGLALAALAVWALIRLGRSGERPGRGHWRIAATMLSVALIGGGAIAATRGSWVFAIGLLGAGLWLAVGSRIRTAPPVRPGMSEAEARSTLGVSAQASDQDINAAWRRLMTRAHPDQGGTEGLAARLNAARDRLLKRRRA
jgi:hypothetical protein